MSNPPISPIGADELDVASTLIDEANALLRQHGADPHNDGTGDDLPVLTEVIFDLGENSSPTSPKRPKPPAPAPTPPSVSSRIPTTAPKPPNLATRTPRPAPETVKSSSAPQTRIPSVNIPASSAFGTGLQALRPSFASVTSRTPAQPASPRTTPAAPSPTPALSPAPSSASAPSFVPSPSPRPPVAQAKPATSNIRQTPTAPPSLSAATSPFSTSPVRQATPAPSSPLPSVQQARSQHQMLAEELKRLDTLIVGEVETWLNEELPALIVREMARLNERLRTDAIAYLRTTLLPHISEHIARLGKPDHTENR